MKRVLLSFLIACVIVLTCGACANKEKADESSVTFKATVLEISESSAMVCPLEGEDELESSDKIIFGIADLEKLDVTVGSIINITYTGEIMESYPAQIKATKWEIVKREAGHFFVGTVLEINENSVLVKPISGDNISGIDKVAFNTDNLPKIDIKVGSKIKVTYNGQVMYSYPAQINALSWQLCE